MTSSWLGKDPAIHVCRAPPDVDHRVKYGQFGRIDRPGDDDVRVSEERDRLRGAQIRESPGQIG